MFINTNERYRKWVADLRETPCIHFYTVYVYMYIYIYIRIIVCTYTRVYGLACRFRGES